MIFLVRKSVSYVCNASRQKCFPKFDRCVFFALCSILVFCTINGLSIRCCVTQLYSLRILSFICFSFSFELYILSSHAFKQMWYQMYKADYCLKHFKCVSFFIGKFKPSCYLKPCVDLRNFMKKHSEMLPNLIKFGLLNFYLISDKILSNIKGKGL